MSSAMRTRRRVAGKRAPSPYALIRSSSVEWSSTPRIVSRMDVSVQRPCSVNVGTSALHLLRRLWAR